MRLHSWAPIEATQNPKEVPEVPDIGTSVMEGRGRAPAATKTVSDESQPMTASPRPSPFSSPVIAKPLPKDVRPVMPGMNVTEGGSDRPEALPG